MPSPFDRSELKEQIKTKRTCSPLDLSKMPDECDQLLNLQPIVHQKNEEEVHDEEIDCGDLFGSKYLSFSETKIGILLHFSWFNI
jgi:hypothetical protein